eukprot:1724900-Rhodomonas_salina.1
MWDTNSGEHSCLRRRRAGAGQEAEASPSDNSGSKASDKQVVELGLTDSLTLIPTLPQAVMALSL